MWGPVRNLFYFFFDLLSNPAKWSVYQFLHHPLPPYQVNVGCNKNLVSGWINVDRGGNARRALRIDILGGLPFENNSVRFMASSHFLEHLTRAEARQWFREIQRVLQPGGVARFAFPELGYFVRQYAAGRMQAFLNDPDTNGDKFNHLFYDYEHRYIYDEETLRKDLTTAGFREVRSASWNQSQCKELQGLEGDNPYKVPCYEAVK
ncbi:MAG TPA: methyltransferase domain-containing protein [Candidatus Diapherotrites archaeon]|uniref:Methyltransferase domain-containing protein n=1 Tax=Candidatus Iainarchaeum sp. TaxID=3101447 RepID=A0A7J4JLT5_9ARCH|nr:methyltransferase domain-containing protein [Candidatus Diapherotrites archaeon]HIH16857.1 methyltransferase domain-containing protein [Candidatus Diapherotrites archaeon]